MGIHVITQWLMAKMRTWMSSEFQKTLLLLFTIILLGNSAEAATGRVITIDGIDKIALATLSISGDSSTGYVYAAIDPDNAREITDKIGPIQPFYWANDPIYTDAAVQSLTDILRTAYTQTKSMNAPLVIVAHSWGTVLAYIVLKQNPDIVVDKLITMGSPLNAHGTIVGDLIGGLTNAKLGQQKIYNINALPNIRLWYNYWTDCDVISASIPAVGGLNINSNYSGDNCHSSYYSTFPTWGEILTRVLDTLPPLAISSTPNPFAKPADVISAPADVVFNAIGSLTSNGSATYSWNFGDGQTSSDKNVPHHYSQPNSYNVTLTMTDSLGPHVLSKSVTVRPPKIEVGIPDGFESLNRSFSTPENSFATEYTWNYGDGSATVTGRTPPKHTFTDSRVYNVTVTLTVDGQSPVSDTESVFVGPGTRYIPGHTINYDETWYSGGTYEVQGDITVAKGGTLTIEPGVTVKLAKNVRIIVNGVLKATGTSSNKIIFTWADNANQWSSIVFSGIGANGSILDNCLIEHAGGWFPAAIPQGIVASWDSSPTISNCSITNSSAYIGIHAYGGFPKIINNSINGILLDSPIMHIKGLDGNGILIDYGSVPLVTGNKLTNNLDGIYVEYSKGTGSPKISGNSYSGNTNSDLFVTGTIAGVVNWNESGDAGYRTDSIIVSTGATLNIANGRTIKFNPDGRINVSGTLKANGVKFTWADGKNQWSGIKFHGNSSSGSKLDNCTIEHASGNYPCCEPPGVIYMDSSPTITGTSITNCDADYGIMVYGGSPVISNSVVNGMKSYGLSIMMGGGPSVTGNKFTGNLNGIGFIGAGVGAGTYQGNTVTGNTQYGLYVSVPGILPLNINATNNNWGDPSGPLDDSDDRATGGLYNPNGKGNRVSDHVNYYPWTGCTISQPTTPTGFSGAPRYASVNLAWNAVNDPNLGGYRIYSGTAPGSYGTPITADKTAAYKASGLAIGTPYYFAVSSLNSVGAESPLSSEITATPINKYILDILLAGTGGGTVLDPAHGIACGAGCSQQFDPGASLTLTKSAADYSLFSGWSGACAGSGDCPVIMSADRSVTATFDKDTAHLVRIDGIIQSYFTSILGALSAAAPGDTIKAWGTDFTENLNLNKVLIFKGGYNTGYTSNSGMTILKGILTVTNGSLTVENLQIQ